jgi:putative PIN family toxin of toxin-antitoxin system
MSATIRSTRPIRAGCRHASRPIAAPVDVAEDGRERVREWAEEDRRHFRVMLAPESGARMVGEDGDLHAFTRETMARMERDLGVGLDWLAVDHHNTDNPHVHVIVRGVRRDGVELLLPREYVSHGLREAARDVATGILGERSIADERLKLEREARSHSLTRLDHGIERELNAANEVRRNVLKLEQDWLERLEAAKALDIRRELAQGRLYEPKLGRVIGEVKELGPRGDTPDRAVLVMETPDHGRVLLNTGMREIEGLEQGSLVALTPAGRSAEIEVLSARSLEAQIHARAETLLDRELDRIARGEKRELPALQQVEQALSRRSQALEREGVGLLGENGKFYFRDGVREALRVGELDRAALDHAKRHGLQYRDLAADPSGRGEDIWRVREVKELFAGRTALLGRGQEIAAVVVKPKLELGVGEEVGVKLLERGGARLVLDTNIVVKAFRAPGGDSAALLRTVRAGKAVMLVTAPLFLEYEQVILRPEHMAAAGASLADANSFLDTLARMLTKVNVHFLWRPQLSDPEDEMVLEAAINGGAEALVTFERNTFEGAADRFGIGVVTPAQILGRIKA